MSVFLIAALAAAATGGQTLSCAGPFHKGMTLAQLKATYGAANVATATFDGPEGSTSPSAVIFGKDAKRRIIVLWRDDNPKNGLSSVVVQEPGSQWMLPGGVGIGSSLAAVEKANGRAFSLYGFEWDYGGLVTDWKGGVVDPKSSTCSVTVRFNPGVENTAASGDSEFSSAETAMRHDRPVVSEIGVGFAD